MDCSLLGLSVHGILQARILEWVTIPFSRGFSRPRYQNPGLLHCRQIQFPGDQGSPMVWGNSLNSTLLEKAWQSKHSISLKKKKKNLQRRLLRRLISLPQGGRDLETISTETQERSSWLSLSLPFNIRNNDSTVPATQTPPVKFARCRPSLLFRRRQIYIRQRVISKYDS